MNDVPLNSRLLVVFSLGFFSGLPLALLTASLQAWFADVGCSLLTIGTLALVIFPHSYRFLWAPLLDRYALLGLGRRRGWILVMQVALMLGFNLMALLSPQSAGSWMMLLATLLAIFSATHDAAVDAHRTEYLPLHAHAMGVSLYVFGYRLALLVGGGVTLIIAVHWGWAVAYGLMGSLMGLGALVTLSSQEPDVVYHASAQPSLMASFLIPIRQLLIRPRIGLLLAFIVFYKLAEAFTATTSGVVMPFLIQGLGFSLDVIAYVNKIAGVVSTILGSMLAGLILMRWSLYRALMLFGLLQASSCMLFIALAIVGKNLPLLFLAVVCENFAAGMSSVAMITLLMRVVDVHYTATQYSMLVAFSTLPRTFSGLMAAVVQVQVGWVGCYALAFVVMLLFVPLLMMMASSKKNKHPEGFVAMLMR